MSRHYGPADQGPLCAAGCGTHIVRQLADAGIAEHPACDRSRIVQERALASWGTETP